MYDSNYVTFHKKQNYRDVKGSVVAGVVGQGRGEKAEHRRFLGQQSTLGYHNGGYMSLYICPNPQDVQHQD